MPKKKKAEHENSERWLLTYADLITLLLGLFVILYSMSQVDLEKFKTMGQAFKTVFAGEQGLPAPGMGSGPYEDAEGGAYPDTSECYLTLKVEEALEGLPEMAEAVSVEVDERGVTVRLMETLMFDLGRAALKPEARLILAKLSGVLVKSERPVVIEGHTDNLPIHSTEYPSNWQLSAARSANVVYFLTQEMAVPQGQLSAAAYSDQRPIASNDLEDGRSHNRRVDIVLLKGQWRSPSRGRALANLEK
jgi:chemotaxis protein MotB